MKNTFTNIQIFNVLVLLAFYMSGSILLGQKGSTALYRDSTFILGFTNNVFYNINDRDLLAASEVLTKEVIDRMAHEYKSKTNIYSDFKSIKKDIKDGYVDVLILSTDEYFNLKEIETLEPRLIADDSPYADDSIILLVHKENNINSLKELKSKKILKLSKGRGNIEEIWLNTQLIKNNCETMYKFFSEVRTKELASQIIIPVFLKQVEACLTSRQTFETMSQLNPQLASSLKVIAESEPLMFAIICVNNNKYIDQAELDLLNNTLDNLAEYGAGNQLMKLFRINKLVPYKREKINSLFKLVQEYNLLLKNHGN